MIFKGKGKKKKNEKQMSHKTWILLREFTQLMYSLDFTRLSPRLKSLINFFLIRFDFFTFLCNNEMKVQIITIWNVTVLLCPC